MADHHSLRDVNRPKQFEDVLGQEHPVKYLSGLIVRGRRARNLLLHGAFGAGKTSLVHIYSRALNCDDVREGGSPCGSCEWCRVDPNLGVGLCTFPTGGKVAPWLSEMNRTPGPIGKFRVLFFDEAHLLTKNESDLLLQAVEFSPERVSFCFATTEFENIRPALRSRLVHLEIKPLSVQLSVRLLKDAAARKGYEYDSEALALLAAFKGGHPRDLLVGLDQVADGQERVTSDRVRFVFDIDHGEVLTSYFFALGDGDLPRETKAMFVWREPAPDKLRWIQACLTSLYYNEILGTYLALDPLVEATTRGGAQIIDRFLCRLGLREPAELAPAWRRLMAFWPVTPVDLDETAVHLRLTLFHHLVNVELSQHSIENTIKRPGAEVRGIMRGPAQLPTGSDGKQQSAFPEPQWLSCFRPQDPRFLRVDDVRELINCASFLIQEHGVLFNAYFEIRPCQFGIDDELGARHFVDEFCADLEAMSLMWSGGREICFAQMTLYEGAGDERRAHVLAHLPRRSADGRIGEASSVSVGAWVAGWRPASREGLLHEAIRFQPAPSSHAKALNFHWNRVLYLCGGLSEDDGIDDAITGEPKSLLDLIGVASRDRRSVGPVNGPLVVRSASLSPDAMGRASRNHMRPLSAFDAQAWVYLRKGWEMKEHHDRARAKSERDRDLRILEVEYEGDVEMIQTASEELMRRWPTDPERRRRSWTGWWPRAEV